MESDSGVDFNSELFQWEDPLLVENRFLPTIDREFENIFKIKEENYKVNNKVKNNNTVLTGVENLNEISPSLADSYNGLDLIQYLTEEPISPTPSSASTINCIEQFLRDEDFSKVQSDSLQMSQTTAVQQNLQTFMLTSTDNAESPKATTINDDAFATMTEDKLNNNHWCVVTRHDQISTINELTTHTVSNRSQQTDVVANTDSDIQPAYTTLQNFPTNKIYSQDYACGSDSSLSTLPSPSPLESKSNKVATHLTRRERNNEASKKLRLKRKRKEEDLNIQEEFLKKQKLELEKEVAALEIKNVETYKYLKMFIKHSAQDNPSNYKQHLSAVFKQHQTLKEDPVYDVVCKKVLKYFGRVSQRYISQEEQFEITNFLIQKQQQQQQQQSL